MQRHALKSTELHLGACFAVSLFQLAKNRLGQAEQTHARMGVLSEAPILSVAELLLMVVLAPSKKAPAGRIRVNGVNMKGVAPSASLRLRGPSKSRCLAWRIVVQERSQRIREQQRCEE